ncbi:serine hydrolase [candidate division KSB1 bacterium]
MSQLLKSKIDLHLSTVLFVNIFILIISASILSAQTMQSKFEEYLTGSQNVLNFSGNVLVMKEGKVLFEKGYGMADISASRPNSPKTRFLIGSITKQFTAAAVMQLSEKKLLDINDPIVKYFPDYPKPAADKVNIYHLLTHTSGIANLTDLPGIEEKWTKPADPEEVLSMFKDIPLQFEPGSEWQYSNSNYYLLGLVIEKVSGEKYGEYLQKHIFEPLGMKNTGYPSGLMKVPGLATGYSFDSDNDPVPAEVLHSSWPYSGGGLYSTVGDMAKWDRGLRDGTVLSNESLSQIFNPVKTSFGFGYGFGWEIDTLYGHQMASHGGLINGFYSHFLRFLDEPFCVVAFSNNEAGPTDRIAKGLTAIVYGEPYDVPVKKIPMAVDAEIFDDYTGVYEVDPDDYNIVTREEDKLFIQQSGGARYLLMAEAEDRFFYDRNNAWTVTFVRDEAGKVIEQVSHRNGIDLRARRVGEEEAKRILSAFDPAEINPAVFKEYEGDYEVAPGFVLTFIRRENRFFTKATGQPEMEIFPRSETEFFLKVVDGSVKFVKDGSGKVTGLVINQGGREIPAKKIK